MKCSEKSIVLWEEYCLLLLREFLFLKVTKDYKYLKIYFSFKNIIINKISTLVLSRLNLATSTLGLAVEQHVIPFVAVQVTLRLPVQA
jgi:hypothetical protein